MTIVARTGFDLMDVDRVYDKGRGKTRDKGAKGSAGKGKKGDSGKKDGGKFRKGRQRRQGQVQREGWWQEPQVQPSVLEVWKFWTPWI